MARTALIVEDDAETRIALADAVSRLSLFDQVIQADSFLSGARELHAFDPDLALIDLDLGDGNGVNLIRSRRVRPGVCTLVISVLGDETNVIAAIEAGADGYLLKDEAFSQRDTLERAVQQAMAGEAPISPGVARHLLKRLRSPAGLDEPASTKKGLTRREQQVLAALARGASYKDVAQQFDLSVHTVGDYVKSLYKKLRVTSRGAAVDAALRKGIIAAPKGVQ